MYMEKYKKYLAFIMLGCLYQFLDKFNIFFFSMLVHKTKILLRILKFEYIYVWFLEIRIKSFKFLIYDNMIIYILYILHFTGIIIYLTIELCIFLNHKITINNYIIIKEN